MVDRAIQLLRQYLRDHENWKDMVTAKAVNELLLISVKLGLLADIEEWLDYEGEFEELVESEEMKQIAKREYADYMRLKGKAQILLGECEAGIHAILSSMKMFAELKAEKEITETLHYVFRYCAQNRKSMDVSVQLHIAEILRVDKKFVYELAHRPDFPIIRFNPRRLRVPKDALLKWMEQLAAALSRELYPEIRLVLPEDVVGEVGEVAESVAKGVVELADRVAVVDGQVANGEMMQATSCGEGQEGETVALDSACAHVSVGRAVEKGVFIPAEWFVKWLPVMMEMDIGMQSA